MKYPTDWHGGLPETPCGGGSKVDNMRQVIEYLPGIAQTLQPAEILELGCGDLNFAANIGFLDNPNFKQYIGIDVKRRSTWDYPVPGVRLIEQDITTLPEIVADLVIARDVFIHLPTPVVQAIIARIRAKHLLATTFPGADNRKRAKEPSAGFQPIDLSAPPFNLPADLLIQEHSKGKFLGVFPL